MRRKKKLVQLQLMRDVDCVAASTSGSCDGHVDKSGDGEMDICSWTTS